MLELFGTDYIFQHCYAELKKKSEQRAVLDYITTGLYCLTNNMCLSVPFEFEPMKPSKEVSADEIINGIKDKLKG